MGDKTRGLYEKFKVERTDGKSAPGQKHDGCEYFTLDLTCDLHAVAALVAYARSCKGEYPLLARDVLARAQAHCDHEWEDTLHGPDTVGQHCIFCGLDNDYDDSDGEYGLWRDEQRQ